MPRRTPLVGEQQSEHMVRWRRCWRDRQVHIQTGSAARATRSAAAETAAAAALTLHFAEGDDGGIGGQKGNTLCERCGLADRERGHRAPERRMQCGRVHSQHDAHHDTRRQAAHRHEREYDTERETIQVGAHARG